VAELFCLRLARLTHQRRQRHIHIAPAVAAALCLIRLGADPDAADDNAEFRMNVRKLLSRFGTCQ
jgi:hypothetical protein